MNVHRWLAIAGPTASGKTALALAQRYPVEIISVDSALVYRGMDIGTAKPTAAELAQVPLYLIDLIDPAQAYSTAEFVKDASALIPQIQARGRLPLLVGGTDLHLACLPYAAWATGRHGRRSTPSRTTPPRCPPPHCANCVTAACLPPDNWPNGN